MRRVSEVQDNLANERGPEAEACHVICAASGWVSLICHESL